MLHSQYNHIPNYMKKEKKKKRKKTAIACSKGLKLISYYKPPCSGSRNTSQTPLDTASRAAQKKFSTMAAGRIITVIVAARGASSHELTTLEI